MSRQDRALKGASRPLVVNLVYRLQRAIPFDTEKDAYLLKDRRILDEAAARILQLESIVTQLQKERPRADASPE